LALLTAENIRKIYTGGETPVEAVCDVSISLDKGDFVAIVGPSGCGKSTLLHLCGAMDQPTSGSVQIEGISLSRLNDNDLTRLRRRRIGFVFQFFNLLPTLTVIENVALPLMLDGGDSNKADRQAKELIERVGLSHRTRHFPQQLSGGEMQRVAIARAIVHRPALLIADEPTGNLDSDNGAKILNLLSEINREMAVTILLATHSREIADAASRVIYMRDGRIERIEQSPRLKETTPSVAI